MGVKALSLLDRNRAVQRLAAFEKHAAARDTGVTWCLLPTK